MLHSLWTGVSVDQAAQAEEALLRKYVSTPFKVSRVPVQLPQLGLGTQRIATVELNPDAPGPVIIWAHGAGAGLGFGFKNYDALANLGGVRRRVLAFDWLGQANSSRPCFPSGTWGTSLLSEEKYVEASLRFFIESFEAWREALGVESMLLFAHSTGAYVAAHYTMLHPERVARLILHGAAGVGSHPEPKSKDEKSSLPRFALALWDAGMLNFGAIQKLGRLAREPGRRRFERFQYARRRCTDPEELELLYNYFWTSLCAQPASSDKWVNAFLRFVDGAEHTGLYARRPIADEPAERLAALPPVSLIFGEDDWVFTPSCYAALDRLPAGSTLHVEPKGFHHLYMDKPGLFHRLAAEAVAGAAESGAKAAL